MTVLDRRSLLRGAGGLGLGVAGASLAGCSSPTGANSEDGFATGDGTLTLVPPAQREKVAALSGTTLDGKSLSLADFPGKVLVLNVWGSWCPPCRHEVPQLVEAARKTARTAQLVGLNTRDNSRETAQAFVRTSGITWPSIFDPDGSLLLALRAVPPKAIPSTLVVDPQGRIAARVLGEVRASTLVGIVDDVVAGR